MPAGRPSGYTPEHAELAKNYCQLGATDREVAEFLQIDVSTLYRWRHSYPEFCDALKSGKDAFDERVERSLANRAVGYSFDSEKVFQSGGEIVRTPTVEHVPPDVTACIFWLKNRRRDEWRDKHEVEHSGKVSLEQLVTGSHERSGTSGE